MAEYRAIDVVWKPRTQKEWAIFTASRLEVGKLWSDMVSIHHRMRRLKWTWPDEARWNKWARGRCPNVSAQSVQQTIKAFLEAVRSTLGLRRNGHSEARFPWRKPKYGNVTYTNQSAILRNGYLILPHGSKGNGKLVIKMPKSVTLPGRLMEVTLEYGRVVLICKTETSKPSGGDVTVGVDLGVNTLIAATDGVHSLVVSGREAKSVIQARAKALAEIQSIRSRQKRGSRRNKRMGRRRGLILQRAGDKIRDICHKATRKVADAFPRAKCFVGKGFSGAAAKMDSVKALQVGEACTWKITRMLDYKLKGAVVVSEAYSSQTCPVCGCRRVCRRKYKCKECGFDAPRDVVGALNIRQIGMLGSLSPTPDLVAPMVTFVHPCKYPGRKPGSP